MKKNIKENVVYESFENKKELIGKILNMIFNSKTDKIIYKGDPSLINYKLMKKVILKDYTEKVEPEKIKDIYNEIVASTDSRTFCLIYKE
jgi:hypothetical protein